MIRAATGHRWLLVLALLASVLALGAAAPQDALATADLALTVTDTPDPAVLGDTLTITARVTNNGNETAYDARVGFGLITNAELGAIAGCQPGPNFASCGFGDVPPAQSRTTSITLRVPEDRQVEEVSLYANADFVDSEGEAVVDPTPADNQMQVTTTVEPRADLKLELSAITPVTMGNTSTVTATVTNTLPGPARQTRLQLTIPPDLPVSAIPPDCVATGLRVNCDLGTITNQATVSRTVTLAVPSEGSYILLGSVAWARADPTPVDAQGQVTITGLSPVEPTDGGPPPTPTAKPVLPKPQAVPISLITSGVPSGRRCVRGRTLRFKLRRPSGIPLTQADIYLGTRRVKRLTGASLTKSVVLRGLPRGRYTVIVVASLRDGGRLSGRRTLRACR